MHRKKFCVESNFYKMFKYLNIMIVHLFEQSDIDIDINI